MFFNAQFHSASGAISFFIKLLSAPLAHIGNYITDISTLLISFHFYYYPLRVFPFARLVFKTMITFYRLFGLLIVFFSRLNSKGGEFMQFDVARQPGKKMDFFHTWA